MKKEEQFHGKNILSYQPNTIFNGREIKEWIRFHIEHETSKSKIAKKMEHYLSIDDDNKYKIIKEPYRSCQSAGDYLIMKI